MERGREGRRGGAGGGPIFAPRRPRTGFKDAAVGDDADDVMDEVHNSRLRERFKKESSGVSGHGVMSSTGGSSSRNKRKRQGSQEIQVQARISPADDLEETTEDTEMGVSEDDDDPPPPIIPRRPGKLRPQAKISEDGNSIDLPAVPRKARTAIVKRPQETLPASMADPPSHSASAVVPSTPAPSSTPSSLSIATMKPGRRTKPMGSKPRASKMPKVATSTLVSEQEVEVAEALFDLARMFTQPPPPLAGESKAESKLSLSEPKSESKPDTKPVASAAASILPMHSSNGPSNGSSTSMSAPASTVTLAGPVTGLSSVPAPAASPIPSPSPPPPGAALPAEAPKKKRPRVRTRPEEGSSTQSRPAASTVSAVSSATGAGVAQPKEVEQIDSRPSTADRGAVKLEANSPSAPTVSATTSNVTVTATAMSSVPSVPCGGAAGTPPLSAPGGGPSSVPRSGSLLEKKTPSLERKNVTSVTESEVANPISVEKKPSIAPPIEKKHIAANLPSSAPAVERELEAALNTTTPPDNLTTKLEFWKRSPQAAATKDGDNNAVKRDIDLMASPIKLPPALSSERNGDGAEASGRNMSEKPLVELAMASSGESPWLDKDKERDREREEKELLAKDRGREEEWERERERERQRELDTQRELSKELAKERERGEREKERERPDLSKQPLQRSNKGLKADNGRSQKAERAASATAASSASPFLASVSTGITDPTSGVASNVTAVPLSSGMLSWPPEGIPGGMSYFPAATGAAAENSPSVQLPPYIMPQRQAWKRCAWHVYIAHFIDMQQQINRHHPYITAANHLYGAKPYNLNMPPESLFGNSSGAPLVGSVTGPSATSSSAGAGNLEASERGLNAAAIAAAVAASIQGGKERAYGMDVLNRKSPVQQQQSAQQQSVMSMQAGPMFGFPVSQTGTPSVTSAVASSATSGAGGGTHLNIPPGAVIPGSSPGSGSGSSMVVGPGPVGGSSSAVGNGAVATAAVQAQYMHAMMQQSQNFPFPQFPPPHFPATFNGPPPHMGAQQAAAQFFASGGPFFATHHLVPHSQQPSGQQIVNAGGGGNAAMPKQQQQQQQQGSRSFPSAGTLQQQGPPPQSPSQSQHLSSQQVQRPSDRDGPVVRENGSSADSKYPMMQRTLYGQASSNSFISNSSPLTSGGAQAISLHPPDHNMLAVLGKPGKQQSQQSSGQQQQQQQLQSLQPSNLSPQLQQQHCASQHHNPGAALQMSVKGLDSQTTQGFPMNMASAANRGSAVGPGPLGLAPVAAVMAPQGHAMLQSMSESGRGHPSQDPHHHLSAGVSHANILQQHQQQQQLIQLQQQAQAQAQAQAQQQQHQQQHQHQQQRAAQIARGGSNVPEDSRTLMDGNYSTGSTRGRERDTVEDRKMNAKRPSGPSSPLSREMEGSSSMQSSPTGAGGMTSSRNVGTTLNLMAPTNPGMSSRSSSHPPPMSVPPSIPQQVIQASKQSSARSKGIPGPNSAPSGGTNQSPLASFADRVSLTGGTPSGKGNNSGLSLPGQNAISNSQGTRQMQVPQHSQIKLNQRTPLGQLATAPTAPTAPGTSLQVVLAAAMAKNPQVQQQQQQRAQQGASGSGPTPRMSTSMSSPPATSSSVPLPPLPPASKTSGLNPPKTGSSQKNSFPLPQKSGSTSGKRSPSPSLPHVSSILGPSPLAQNMSSKGSQQQQGQNPHQLPQQQVQRQPQTSQQGQGHSTQHQQQFHPQQQGQPHKQSLQQQHQQQQPQQMIRQQFFQQTQMHILQHQQQQQLQPSHSQSLQAAPSHQQPAQPPSHQQPSSQQQLSPTSSQPQQHSSHQQHQLQNMQQQQQQQQPSSFPGSAANGGLTLGSALSLDTVNKGNSTNLVRGMNSESAGGSQSLRPAQSLKQSPNTSVPMSNSNTQRSNSAGPTFLQQFGSPAALPSGGQQQSGSPRNSTPSAYNPATTNSGAGGRSSDSKSISDGSNQEQLNGMRMMPGPSPSRPPSTMSSSPTLQPPSQRSQTSGPPNKPASGHFNGSDYGEQARSMLLSANTSSPTANSSSNVQTNNNANMHIGADGRPAFVSGTATSLHQGVLNPSQMHPTSSMSMVAPMAVAPSGPSPLLGQQPPTSVVQQ